MTGMIKKLIPEKLLNRIRPYYHGVLAWDANIYFDRPSESLIVVGITGTAGKSTTIHLLAHILNTAGLRTGFITTVDFFDGKRIFVNKHGLSMPNEILLQKQLRAMADRKCKIAILECTSEGLAQNRHLGINFDAAIFTNLSQAHLEAHGSFGNYQETKGKLFAALEKHKKKSFFPKKIIGANLDDPSSGYFISFPAEEKFGVTFKKLRGLTVSRVFAADMVKNSPQTEFKIDGVPFFLDLLGDFNAQNAALAVSCAVMLGITLEKSARALDSFHGVRGRMEEVSNNLGFKVIVDYGCEPVSVSNSLIAVSQIPHNRIIHVFGSTGGHRDKAKRFIFGQTSAEFSDSIIITNDDIYDSNPADIAHEIEEGIKSFMLKKPNYEIILDRRAAIARALSVAQKNDIVLISGKGSEQFLVLPGNKRIDWDDAAVARQELAKLST